MSLRRWRLVVPTSASTVEETGSGTLLVGSNGSLAVAVTTPWAATRRSVRATGDSPQGRGVRGSVPLHLIYEASNVRLAPGEPVTWRLTLRVVSDGV
jgi:hypothetical protein